MIELCLSPYFQVAVAILVVWGMFRLSVRLSKLSLDKCNEIMKKLFG